eukprot:TRINITY_DN8289_c0_g1_i1.p4 TRINITY_DN8289_c0_g1~~TRINITY_DN8289_c0_g1_i1.p4  ORF type:complete len:103 (-),score=17.44 TRINITY_DN8289_c0_g1_i1:365-673(-)
MPVLIGVISIDIQMSQFEELEKNYQSILASLIQASSSNKIKNNLTFCQLEQLRSNFKCSNLKGYNKNCSNDTYVFTCNQTIQNQAFCGTGLITFEELDDQKV